MVRRGLKKHSWQALEEEEMGLLGSVVLGEARQTFTPVTRQKARGEAPGDTTAE